MRPLRSVTCSAITPWPPRPCFGKVLERRELAVAVFRSGQDISLVGHDQRIDALIVARAHAAHAGGLAAHRPHLVLDEADRLAAGREQQDVARAVGDRDADQLVALIAQATAMMPLARGRENSASEVFLTVPCSSP
jgi:hypothetical protein